MDEPSKPRVVEETKGAFPFKSESEDEGEMEKKKRI